MSDCIMRHNTSYRLPRSDAESNRFVYYNEKRLDQFLEQGMKMKRDFLAKLEEVKRADEFEEEEKLSQSE